MENESSLYDGKMSNPASTGFGFEVKVYSPQGKESRKQVLKQNWKRNEIAKPQCCLDRVYRLQMGKVEEVRWKMKMG